MCGDEGQITAATVVDHIQPHKGDQALMWDWNNLQALCFHHHNSHKQREERGTLWAIGVDGWPI